MRIRYYQGIPNTPKPRLRMMAANILSIAALCLQWIFIVLHTLFTKRRTYRHEVALCLIFRNEAQFLREWIEYYLLIGVDHFYLYNNLSDDNYLEVLQPYIDNGTVTLTEWPYEYTQVEAYNDCYRRFRNDAHWIGYIDADEFINLRRDNSIKALLHSFRRYPSLTLHWRDFGTSGHTEYQPGELVTERYTAAWPWLCHLGKAFINNDYDFCRIWIHEHWARYLGMRLYPVADNKLPVPYAPTLWRHGIGRRAYINHYFSRSYDWYIYKDFKRGDVDSADNMELKKRKGRFEMHELNCSTRDYSIQRWLVLLKLRMGKGKQHD